MRRGVTRGLVDRPRPEVGLDLDAGARARGRARSRARSPTASPWRARRTGAAPPRARRSGGPPRSGARARVRGSLALSGPVPVVGVHPELAAGPIPDRRRLTPVIGVGVGAREQPTCSTAQAHLIHRALELRDRSRLVHAGVDEHDPVAGRDRPGVAVRDACHGSGSRSRHRPGITRSPRPSSRLRDMAAHDIRSEPRLGGDVERRRRHAVLRGRRRARSRRRDRLLVARRGRSCRRSARADRARRDPSVPRRAARRVPRPHVRGARRDRLGGPCRGALARVRHVRRPRPVPGVRAQRRAARDRGLRRPHGDRRPDRAPRRLSRQRRRRPPARRASAGRLPRRDAPDPARQRAHTRALVDPGLRPGADRRRRVGRPRRLPEDR